MAPTKQDYLSSIFGDLQLPYRGTSMSVGDYAKQTGLGQKLSDFQNAYADSVLKGKQAGEDILKQGDKAFSSSWYEILQRALEADALQRATGGELGTDFAGSYSTMLAAMREAGAGATEQQMAYTNLSNKIAELMAQSNVQAMGDYKDQAAALAAYYAEMMQADAMFQQNDINLLSQLLSEYGNNQQYYGGSGAPIVNNDAVMTGGSPTTPTDPAQSGASGLVQAINELATGNKPALQGPKYYNPSMIVDALQWDPGLLGKRGSALAVPKNNIPYVNSDLDGLALGNAVANSGWAKSIADFLKPKENAMSVQKQVIPPSIGGLGSPYFVSGTPQGPSQDALKTAAQRQADADAIERGLPAISFINPNTGGETQDEKDRKKRQQATATQSALIRQQAAQQSIKQNSVAQALQSVFNNVKKPAAKKTYEMKLPELPQKRVGSSSVRGTISRNKTGASNVGQPGVWFNPGTGGGTVTGPTRAPAPSKPDRTGAIKGPVYKFK